MLRTIAQILDSKGHEVWCVAPEDKIADALNIMRDKQVGALVVLEDRQVVGLFSERDYATKVDFCGSNCAVMTVRDVMTNEVYCVTLETSIDEAMVLVTKSRCRHLPVIENDQLVGLVSIGDLVKATIDEKDFLIKQLTQYIKGGE
ncbi:MAG: CBS domain-containing protein [Deltaproteobacteria bacterium]|jgi:CBS domain-containing protein|nr:CBS domain-containing protein [Deltaproteobacteria bacterium]